jgi:dTDP-4-amino-4,6-dideoxygalactose transaminase
MTRVPLNDLHAQYLSIREDVDRAIADVIATSAFIRGPAVDRFEASFAEAIGTQHCVSCANGTDALYIAMHSLGIKQGDEVLVPAQSWIATSETVTQANGVPVFCDIDPLTHTIDLEDAARKITARTVGIIPVHLYGQPADMTGVMQLATKHGLWVVEDCAQAHLAEHGGQKVGTFGNAATFSFYPGKNLGAMGDAGAIVTNDPALARRMAMFARHGGLRKGDHVIEGINSRLDGLQAAILNVKLPHLRRWTEARQRIAQQYISEMNAVATPVTGPGNSHVYHLFVVMSDQRDALSAHLKSNGVDSAVNYPVALPFVPAYDRFSSGPSDFPNAHANQGRILSLPLYPEMSEEQVAAVIAAVRSFAFAS